MNNKGRKTKIDRSIKGKAKLPELPKLPKLPLANDKEPVLTKEEFFDLLKQVTSPVKQKDKD